MRRASSIFAIWLFAYLLSYFYRSANAVIAAELRSDIGLGNEQLGFMTSLFYLAFAVTQLPLGAALDRWGSRLVTPVLMLVAAAGSMLFSVGESYLVLSVARALLGIGFAGVLMGAMKAFASWYPVTRFATVSGILVGIGSSGALLAGTPMAWLAGNLGWRAIFAWGAGVVLLAAAIIAFGARNAPAGTDWRSRDTADGGFGAIARDHRFWRISLLNFATVGTMFAVQGLWGGPYLADLYSLGDLQVGNALVALGIGVVAGNLASGWLADLIGRGTVVLGSGAAFIVLQLLFALALPTAPLMLLYLLFGLFGSYFVVLVAEVRSLFPANVTGRAMTGVNFFGMAGAMLLQWLMGMIIGSGADVAGYRLAFLVTAVLTAIAALVYLPVVTRSRSPAAVRS